MKQSIFFSLLSSLLLTIGCHTPHSTGTTRGLADTVGFARYDWQMDSLLQRGWLNQNNHKHLLYADTFYSSISWKVVISPHDDYAYVGSLYPQLLQSLQAHTLIIFGVAHKARAFRVADQLVFDSFATWHGPYQYIPVAPLREELMRRLPTDFWQKNDSLQTVEHSVEALLPFIQHFNRRFAIVSILVPYMSLERMQTISQALAKAIAANARREHWQWGKDFAIAISSDAVHYGDEDWGGKNYAPYGVGAKGYRRAVEYEHEIISNCLTGALDPAKIARFVAYTVQESDYREYKWTWCGRYSVPLGLFTAYYLQQELNQNLTGTLVGYSTSIEPPVLQVNDLRMGLTAPANLHHWVGYAALGYY